jgi:hypothetical protein
MTTMLKDPELSRAVLQESFERDSARCLYEGVLADRHARKNARFPLWQKYSDIYIASAIVVILFAVVGIASPVAWASVIIVIVVTLHFRDLSLIMNEKEEYQIIRENELHRKLILVLHQLDQITEEMKETPLPSPEQR